jgi:phage gp46-like protein
MDYTIQVTNGEPGIALTSGNSLFNNVFLSLEIPQGSWWFDPSFGLKKRSRMKITAAAIRLRKHDVESALQWLLDHDRAASVVVEVERDTDNRSRLHARATVTAPTGDQVVYDKFIEVV